MPRSVVTGAMLYRAGYGAVFGPTMGLIVGLAGARIVRECDNVVGGFMSAFHLARGHSSRLKALLLRHHKGLRIE